MLIKKSQIPILAINAIALAIFIIIFLSRENYEFLIYIGVIVFFLLLIIFTNKKVNYPNDLLWGLTVWSILHMIGGGIFIGGKTVYSLMLIPIIGEPYNIFKYDQLVHFIGFGIATLLMYHLLKPSLQKNKSWISLSIVVIMAGLGVGALNEIIEFLATVIMPETGVGGYENTAIDLVANLFGAIVAMIYIKKSNK
jgi:putative membrane protein